MKHILLNGNHNISDFASTDSARYILQSVHFNKEKQCLEATNGMIAIRVPVVKDEMENFPPIEGSLEAQDCIIPVDKFEKAMKNMPKKLNRKELNNVVLSSTEKNKIVFTTNDLDQQNDLKVKELEGNFPNIDQCTPTEPATLEVTIAAELLKPLAEYAIKNSIDKLHSGIKFSFIDTLSVVRFEVKTESGPVTGLICPMRTS